MKHPWGFKIAEYLKAADEKCPDAHEGFATVWLYGSMMGKAGEMVIKTQAL